MGESASTFLSFLGTLITAVIGWMGEILTFITENPVILIPMLVFFITGGTVALVQRVMRG